MAFPKWFLDLIPKVGYNNEPFRIRTADYEGKLDVFHDIRAEPPGTYYIGLAQVADRGNYHHDTFPNDLAVILVNQRGTAPRVVTIDDATVSTCASLHALEHFLIGKNVPIVQNGFINYYKRKVKETVDMYAVCY